MDPVRIGLIGCGIISGDYLRAAATFDILRFVGCADIDPSAARRTEERFGVPAMSVDELLGRDDVEVILNLTVPAAHTAVNLAAIGAGKHAYCENHWPSTRRKANACSKRRPPPACGWAARRTRFWAAAIKRCAV